MLVFICVLAALVLAASVGMFFYVFYSPDSKRKIPETYVFSRSYKNHAGVLAPYLAELKAEPFEKVSIVSFDGLTLNGRYYHYADGAPFVIMMHGYRACCYGDFGGQFQIMRELGFNILLIEERGCGTSEGRVITFGVNESRDCISWTDYLICRFGGDIKIALYGVSMGAATVLTTLGRGCPDNVKAVVEDCGFTSPKEIIKDVARGFHVLVDAAYPFCRAAARVLGGFDPDSVSAIEAVKHTDVPVLFIHGEKDTYVPFYMCGELYEACASRKELFTVPEATHAVSFATDIPGYTQKVKSFIRSVDWS